jgi:formylglycine-generating enzyme required for sulfatase activity
MALLATCSLVNATDSDFDGLDDSVETNTGVYVSPTDTGTNPNSADSDGDGLSDTYELIFRGDTDAYVPRLGDRVWFDLNRLGYQGTYKLVGTLPKGLTFNPTTRFLDGKLIGTAGTSKLTIQVLNGKTVVKSIPLSIPVLAFPTSLAGTWQALLENDQGKPEGLITVVVTSPGNWSASYDGIGTRTIRKARGAFDLKTSMDQALWNITFPAVESLPSATISFGIDGNTALADGTHPRGDMLGFRLARGTELPLKTSTITMLIDQGVQDGFVIPAGTGWATGSISNRGAVALKGQLGDAQAITTTLSLGATGQALMWLKPYKNLNSYIGGIASLHGSGVLPASPLHKQESELWWYRAADATELGYAGGFDPLAATVGVRTHMVPANSLALSQNLGLTGQVIPRVVFEGGGLPDPNAAAKLPEAFIIDASYKIAAYPMTRELLAPWSGSIAPSSGKFTGAVGVVANNHGTLTGNATVSGVLFQTQGYDAVGAGMVKIPIAGTKGSFRTGAISLLKIPPTITTQPVSKTIVGGSTATLTVNASGSSPLTFQWYQGSVGKTTTPVGTNSATFTTPVLTETTTYWVRVSISTGSVDSTPTTVTVAPELALIPAGAFYIGVTSGDTDSDALPSNGRPNTVVNVSNFYIGKYEVSKALWDEVRTWAVANGYTDMAAGAGKAADHPVQTVSWWDVVKWCNARSQKEGLTPCYRVSRSVMKTGTTAPTVNWTANGYRLPTEAEWEIAARGGVFGKRFPWGMDTISHSEANFCNDGSEKYKLGTTGYHPTYNDGTWPYTSPVGSFAANGYGLHDMAGNVEEWCWDWYNESTYLAVFGDTDPRGVDWGWDRVVRGGSWLDTASGCRAANRFLYPPWFASHGNGFRVARSSVP